jgi:cell division control protein 6
MDAFWSKIMEWKSEEKRFLLLCFDEVDMFFSNLRSDPSGFLYQLVRNEDRLEGMNITVSLITISNNPIWDYWDLDVRVKSSMGVEELFFQPYSKEELEKILFNRIHSAFHPGVVDEMVIKRIVEYTAEQSGDVRRMVDLLRMCGDIAWEDKSEKMVKEHVDKAIKRMESDYYKKLLGKLPNIQQFLLIAMAMLLKEGTETLSINEVFTFYQQMFGEQRVGYRRISGILKEMEVSNLIGGRNISKGQVGYSREVWLKIPAQFIYESEGIALSLAEDLAKRDYRDQVIQLVESSENKRKTDSK